MPIEQHIIDSSIRAILVAKAAIRNAETDLQKSLAAHTLIVAGHHGLAMHDRVAVHSPAGPFKSTITGFRMDADRLDPGDLWVKIDDRDQRPVPDDLFPVTQIVRETGS